MFISYSIAHHVGMNQFGQVNRHDLGEEREEEKNNFELVHSSEKQLNKKNCRKYILNADIGLC